MKNQSVTDVLIIEDETVWQENIVDILHNRLNLTYQIAPDYFTALSLLQTTVPALITLDLTLNSQRMSIEEHWEGWKIARFAQAQQIPLIIISSHARADKISKAFITFQDVVRLFVDKSYFREQVAHFEHTVIELVLQRHRDIPQQIAQARLERPQQNLPIRFETVRGLQDILSQNFDKAELEGLCFELQIEYEELRGQRRSEKARELIAYFQRHGRLPELQDAIQTHRPHLFSE